MKKKLNRYLYLGRKYNKFRFGEKRRKIENMVSLPTFFINMPIRYQNMRNFTDLCVTKNWNDSVNFIGSRDIYGMVNILDISAVAVR